MTKEIKENEFIKFAFPCYSYNSNKKYWHLIYKEYYFDIKKHEDLLKNSNDRYYKMNFSKVIEKMFNDNKVKNDKSFRTVMKYLKKIYHDNYNKNIRFAKKDISSEDILSYILLSHHFLTITDLADTDDPNLIKELESKMSQFYRHQQMDAIKILIVKNSIYFNEEENEDIFKIAFPIYKKNLKNELRVFYKEILLKAKDDKYDFNSILDILELQSLNNENKENDLDTNKKVFKYFMEMTSKEKFQKLFIDVPEYGNYTKEFDRILIQNFIDKERFLSIFDIKEEETKKLYKYQQFDNLYIKMSKINYQ